MVVRDEQRTAKTSAAATTTGAGTADGVHVGERQVVDRNIAGIDEKATIAADTVDGTTIDGRAVAVDRQRFAGAKIDRGRIDCLGFIAEQVDV